MKVEIIRSKRKTLSLQITAKGELIARAPLRMKDETINRFIQQKRSWIEKALLKTKEKEALKNTFDFENNIYILGNSQPVEYCDIGYSSIKKGEGILVYDKIYKDLAKRLLPKMAEEVSQAITLGYKALKITTSKRYWGCYSKDGTMRLNYKLVVLPENVIKYVIIHELCHSKELNHSARFWALVSYFCPEFKKYKKELEMYSFLLSE